MPNYRNLVEQSLNKNRNRLLAESMIYPEGMKERMHPKLEEDLLNNRTSLGNSPCFPVSDEKNFETKVVIERFKDVINEVKKAFNIDEIDNMAIMKEMKPLVDTTMEIESEHKKQLEELAIKMIKDEFGITDEVEMVAELTPYIEDANPNELPSETIVEFDDHDEIVFANDSVYKRRFQNAINQGAAKKVNHMYHLADKELTDMNPRLLNNYKKMMSAADYTYFLYPDLGASTNAGSCDIEFPKKKGEKAILKVKAMVFPVLVHELYKSCMEVLSANGLPTKENIAEYVINKADYLQAEPWDMRIGPGLWGRFCMMIPTEDFNLKHHVYFDISALEPKEFSSVMKEIMGGTNKGKQIVSELMKEIKKELKEDDYREAMGDDNVFEIEDLF
jgi:hypothetical protein